MKFNLTEWALNHRAIVLFLIIVIGVGGTLSFTRLGQLEDPSFSVPSMTAIVIWPGATATLVSQRAGAEQAVAAIPAAAITQANGKPALWVLRRDGSEPVATVHLTGVEMHGYRNDEVLVSGLPAGALVVTAGVQKMAPGLRVALPGAAGGAAAKQAAQ